jgi:hypothetical protein
MKKAKTKVHEKTGIATSNKIALGFMMAAALFTSLNFAVAMFKVDKQLIVRAPRRTIQPIRVQPLILQGMQDAKVNLNIPGVRVHFFNGDEDLGSLDLGMQYFNTAGPIINPSKRALRLEFIQEGMGMPDGPMAMPARIINVADSASDLRYNLCVPVTSIPADDNITNRPKYFYDTNGTPYYDSLLTNRALDQDCDVLLANALDINVIDDAAVNLEVPGTPPNFSSIRASFLTDFTVYQPELGALELATNSYHMQGWDGDETASPLAVRFSHYGDEDQTLPARIIAISNANYNQEYTLCVPTSNIPQTMYLDPGEEPEEVIYFYDTNGTPYYDSLLTNRALDQDCDVLLANALDVSAIDRAGINFAVRPEAGIYDGIYVDFLNDFDEYQQDLGRLQLMDNQYMQNGWDEDDIVSPLAIRFFQHANQLQTLPARVMFIRQPEPGSAHYTLCVPTTEVPSIMQDPGNEITYFYDTNGTPYYDSLLTDRALPRDCDDILANSLTINNIEGASISEVISDPEGALAGFARNAGALGTLDLSNNNYNSSFFEDPEVVINDPMVLILGHASNDAEKFPYRTINIEGEEQNYRLCVPPSMIPGFDDNPNNYRLYFYDRFGKPYHDSLLLNRATCPPLRIDDIYPIEAIPN